MINVKKPNARSVLPAGAELPAVRRRRLSLLILLAGVIGYAFVVIGGRVIAEPRPGEAGGPAGMNMLLAAQEVTGDFSRFSHATPRHRDLQCASCHQRESNSPTPSIPGHKACTDCHLPQFTQQAIPMCNICHTNLEGSNPPVKNFPPLRSFNAKFDHAQHDTGDARPEQGCAYCHSPIRRRVALSIPAGLTAHRQCYECHTPGSQSGGRDIASCGVCHDLGRYGRTSTNSRAYRVTFSHGDHGPRQRLGCADCHNLRAGAGQTQQVSSPRPTQHFPRGREQSCATCHNNRRTFGGNDFGDCKRCHKGTTFRLGL